MKEFYQSHDIKCVKPLKFCPPPPTFEKDAIIIKREKFILALLSTPIIGIAFISVLNIIMDHAPYFNGNCRHVNCVAGSGEQFAMWSILFILFVYCVLHFVFK